MQRRKARSVHSRKTVLIHQVRISRLAYGSKHAIRTDLLDCIAGDGKPRVSADYTNTVTIKTTAPKGKAYGT
jgi:hypothetical protein